MASPAKGASAKPRSEKKFLIHIHSVPLSCSSAKIVRALESDDPLLVEEARAALEFWRFGWRVETLRIPDGSGTFTETKEIRPRALRVIEMTEEERYRHWTTFVPGEIKGSGPASQKNKGEKQPDPKPTNASLNRAFAAHWNDRECEATRESFYKLLFFYFKRRAFENRPGQNVILGADMAEDLAQGFALQVYENLQAAKFHSKSSFTTWALRCWWNFRDREVMAEEDRRKVEQQFIMPGDDDASDDGEGEDDSNFLEPAHLKKLALAEWANEQRMGLDLDDLELSSTDRAIAQCYMRGQSQKETAAALNTSVYKVRQGERKIQQAIAKVTA